MTPWYSGEPPFTENLNKAFKFRSGKVANEAGKNLAGDFQVLPLSQLG
jgi:hypothetical protein